ncbi:MAG: hypothetical protein J3R72DRAFT_486602 [Linnemannia gamsii]|nr:MAG: hypothetical protein J3R72DRAFT_486602 [Linnemannia gamsii]
MSSGDGIKEMDWHRFSTIVHRPAIKERLLDDESKRLTDTDTDEATCLENSFVWRTRSPTIPNFLVRAPQSRNRLGFSFIAIVYWTDVPSIVLENDAQLVEAAFGRFKLFGGAARIVLDEPLALKAIENYFHEKGPSFVSAAEGAMLHSDNPSVHGKVSSISPAEVVNIQVVRPDPKPELEGLQRVSIEIDDYNLLKIFSLRHIEFLHKLKGLKRSSEHNAHSSVDDAFKPSNFGLEILTPILERRELEHTCQTFDANITQHVKIHIDTPDYVAYNASLQHFDENTLDRSSEVGEQTGTISVVVSPHHALLYCRCYRN